VHIRLTGTILGGPHDGARLVYKADVIDEQWSDKMAFLEWEGHQYKIIAFDKKKQHLTLQW